MAAKNRVIKAVSIHKPWVLKTPHLMRRKKNLRMSMEKKRNMRMNAVRIIDKVRYL